MANNNNKMVMTAVFSGMIGAVAALLMAPKSGRETRQDIKNLADDARKKTTDSFQAAKSAAKEGVDSLRQSKDRVVDSAKETASQLKAESELTSQKAKNSAEDVAEAAKRS